ncbi:MAG: hypothetical protein CV087_22730 [Candidatus Brocadia sp. WS118]|nr:MAG: hypothetical protein CV087_22730 [Candidatus Brocadia sp. WS118]
MQDIFKLLQNAGSEEERDWIVMQFSLDNLKPELQEAVWGASLLRWFDEKYLKATLNNPAFNGFEELIALSFVEPFGDRGFNIHERSRKMLEKHLWHEKAEYYLTLSQRACEYCSSQNLEDVEWMIEYTGHLLITNPVEGSNQFENICVKWWNPPFFAYEKIEALLNSIGERAHATLNSPKVNANYLYWKASVAQIQDQYDTAKSLYEKALLLFRQVGSKNGEANTFIGQGDVARLQDQYDAARSLYEKALPLFREDGDKLGEANALIAQGDVARRQLQYDVAGSLYEKALSLYQKIGVKLGEANTLVAQGDITQIQAQYDTAKSLYEKALSLYQELGDKLGEANTFISQGDVALMQAQYDVAGSLYERALPLYREVGSKLGEANTLKAQGDVARMQAQYDAAGSLYERALPLYREVGSKLGEANTLKAQGDIARMEAQYDTAKKKYEQSRKIYDEIKDEFGESDCVFVFGELDRARGKWHQAISKYRKALLFYETKGLPYEEALVLWQLGMAFYGAKDHKLAKEYLEKALNKYKTIKRSEANKVHAVLDALIKGTPIDAKTQFE